MVGLPGLTGLWCGAMPLVLGPTVLTRPAVYCLSTMFWVVRPSLAVTMTPGPAVLTALPSAG